MRVLHTSDLHGYMVPGILKHEDFDIWIDTGDFFPNETRGIQAIETTYQNNWLNETTRLADKIVEWLAGKPAIICPGNHDYASLTNNINSRGGNAFEITPKGVTINGIKFSGFRHIPFIAGEWNGEIHDFDRVIKPTMVGNPDVLVTHAPPSGILDEYLGVNHGITGLTSVLAWSEHNIKTHFFGHIHGHGGETTTTMNIKFINGAQKIRHHEI